MINESGTMSGGGGKPRGGRMCLGKAALASVDTQAAAAELQAAEQELEHGAQVQCICQHMVLASQHAPMLLTVDLCHKGVLLLFYKQQAHMRFGWCLVATLQFRCCIGACTCIQEVSRNSSSWQPVPTRLFAANYCASH
jgi:hypothetical protein